MTTPPHNGDSGYPEYPGQGPFGNNNANQGDSNSQYFRYAQYPSTPHPEDAPGFGSPGTNSGAGFQGGYPSGGYPSGGYPQQQGFSNEMNTGLNPHMVNTDGRINVMRAVKWGVGETFSNAGVFIVGTLVTALVMFAISAVGSLLVGSDSQSLAYSAFEVVVSLVSAAWMIFVMRLMIWQVDKNKAKYSDLFKDVHFWPGFVVSIVASLVTSLIVAVPLAGWAMSNAQALSSVDDPIEVEQFITNEIGSLLGILGIVLLVAVLIYPLIMFPTEYATEGRAGIGGSFAGAFQVGKNNYGRLLAYIIVMGILGTLIVILTLGWGILVVAPASMLIRAHMYRQGVGGPIPHDAEHDGPVNGYGNNYGYSGYNGFA